MTLHDPSAMMQCHDARHCHHHSSFPSPPSPLFSFLLFVPMMLGRTVSPFDDKSNGPRCTCTCSTISIHGSSQSSSKRETDAALREAQGRLPKWPPTLKRPPKWRRDEAKMPEEKMLPRPLPGGSSRVNHTRSCTKIAFL